MEKKRYRYDEDFFQGYTADFTKTDFDRMFNWFLGLLTMLDSETHIAQGEGKKAIEFGCALGAASKVLSNFGYQVLATDVSAYSVERAKKLCPELSFRIHDIQKTFGFNKYHIALALDVIEHLEYPEKAIHNIYNVLKPLGWAIVSTPNDYKYAIETPSHINVKKPTIWKQLFRKAGFRKVIVCQKAILPFLYRFHWKLMIILPLAIDSRFICSPVFILAQK